MRTSLRRLAPAFLLFVAPALAGPYDQPYSLIVTDTALSADPKQRPVLINRVDGESALRNEAIVAPGKRKVTVDLPPRKGFRIATQETFELDVKACTRYYVVAKLVSETGQSWKPAIGREEPIGECAAKFNLKPVR